MPMIFSTVSIIAAMFFVGLAYLLQVFRARTAKELTEQLSGLLQQLNMPRQSTLKLISHFIASLD
jgi:hypothetical protein